MDSQLIHLFGQPLWIWGSLGLVLFLLARLGLGLIRHTATPTVRLWITVMAMVLFMPLGVLALALSRRGNPASRLAYFLGAIPLSLIYLGPSVVADLRTGTWMVLSIWAGGLLTLLFGLLNLPRAEKNPTHGTALRTLLETQVHDPLDILVSADGSVGIGLDAKGPWLVMAIPYQSFLNYLPLREVGQPVYLENGRLADLETAPGKDAVPVTRQELRFTTNDLIRPRISVVLRQGKASAAGKAALETRELASRWIRRMTPAPKAPVRGALQAKIDALHESGLLTDQEANALAGRKPG